MSGPDGEQPITDHEYMVWAYSIDPKATPPPEEPEIVDERLWGIFWTLHGRRRPGFGGPAPISFTDISAWAALTRQYVRPEEVEILTRMDDAYLRAYHEGDERKRKREERKQKSRK